MPRYFFDIKDGVDVRDDVGIDLADMTAARAHAIRRTADFVSHLDNDGDGGYLIVTIRDESQTLLKIRLVCQMSPL